MQSRKRSSKPNACYLTQKQVQIRKRQTQARKSGLSKYKVARNIITMIHVKSHAPLDVFQVCLSGKEKKVIFFVLRNFRSSTPKPRFKNSNPFFSNIVSHSFRYFPFSLYAKTHMHVIHQVTFVPSSNIVSSSQRKKKEEGKE